MVDQKDKSPGAGVRPGGGEGRPVYSPTHRLVVIDLALKSGLPLREFAGIVNIPYATLSSWKVRYEKDGPEGLLDKPRGHKESGSRLPEVTKRAVIMIRESHPEYGCERISDMLGRGPGLGASPGAVLRVIREAGLGVESPKAPRHRDVPRRFERARPNQLWQTDIFSFTLKRQNRRLYLVVFLDDNSRYVVGYGLHASMTGALVIEALKSAIGSYGPPEEVLSDQGPQYNTWRGKSRFTKELERLGIRHILARARHPQTLGKTERFWGTLWRECVSAAVFLDVEDARRRVGHFIDHYNFQRTHQGIDGLVPADRFFGAGDEVRKTLEARVGDNALSLAKEGVPRKPFYLTGRVGEVDLSIHAEGERVVLNTADGRREEVDLRATGRRAQGGVDEVMPDPVVNKVEEESDGGEDGDKQESDKGEAEAGRDRGGEAPGGGSPGSDERGAGPGGGVGGSGDIEHEVLRTGGEGDPGDGEGAGAPSPGEEGDVTGGRDIKVGEGAGPPEAGAGPVPGPSAGGQEEREVDGAVEAGEEAPAPEQSSEEADRASEGAGSGEPGNTGDR
jgi:transposase InsO family protein